MKTQQTVMREYVCKIAGAALVCCMYLLTIFTQQNFTFYLPDTSFASLMLGSFEEIVFSWMRSLVSNNWAKLDKLLVEINP
ncbi:MAG: hypothetical protein GY801_16490 [bacterium]|nr:hypothetical protein [bacterium]